MSLKVVINYGKEFVLDSYVQMCTVSQDVGCKNESENNSLKQRDYV